MTLPPLHSVADQRAKPGLYPTASPAWFMLSAIPGPRLMTLPPLHSVASTPPPKPLTPTACPAWFMLTALLDVEPGKPPSLTTLPSLHSVAHGLHWAGAEPAVPPSRQTTAKRASPDAFQCDMSSSPRGAICQSPVT